MNRVLGMQREWSVKPFALQLLEEYRNGKTVEQFVVTRRVFRSWKVDYYELARGDTLQHLEATHPGFSRMIHLLGGIMGSHVPSFPPYRRPSAEYSHEQARFIAQARAAAEQRRRMEKLELELQEGD